MLRVAIERSVQREADRPNRLDRDFNTYHLSSFFDHTLRLRDGLGLIKYAHSLVISYDMRTRSIAGNVAPVRYRYDQ